MADGSKARSLTKRYNADNSLSLLSGGHVVFRAPLGRHADAEHFAIGWFGHKEPNWGKPQFRLRAPSRRYASLVSA